MFVCVCVCCSVLRGVTVCCSVLQRVAACCRFVIMREREQGGETERGVCCVSVAVCCSVCNRANKCSVLKCVAVC